ncbi:MAG: hypothetical protein ABR562_06910, partial [Thermoplasmatota archaeon]
MDFESLWSSLPQHFGQKIWPQYDWNEDWKVLVGWIGVVVMVAALAWLSSRVLRHRFDPLVAGTVLVATFLLVNKVYSPQYTLWILPLL